MGGPAKLLPSQALILGRVASYRSAVLPVAISCHYGTNKGDAVLLFAYNMVPHS